MPKVSTASCSRPGRRQRTRYRPDHAVVDRGSSRSRQARCGGPGVASHCRDILFAGVSRAERSSLHRYDRAFAVRRRRQWARSDPAGSGRCSSRRRAVGGASRTPAVRTPAACHSSTAEDLRRESARPLPSRKCAPTGCRDGPAIAAAEPRSGGRAAGDRSSHRESTRGDGQRRLALLPCLEGGAEGAPRACWAH